MRIPTAILDRERPSTSDRSRVRPTKLELIINLKTAKALGITIPLSLVLRADEIIQ